MRRSSRGVGAALFALALVMSACSDDSGAGGSADEIITIADFTFDPSTLSVPSGQDVTVEVTNNDDVEHSFTLDDDSVSQDVHEGETQTVTLNLTEGIGWHCEYHPDQMKGTITVS
ncbi:MAG TPA: cupredoxin domain-containing protein [Actinomycetota bacterium]|jgi:plastocyanin|nr:cupredoxin domain-containing protein [Actinomycetota bacterium]